MNCTVTCRHMLTLMGMSTWSLGCEHNALAVISVSMVDEVVHVSLLLENKTVSWRLSRGRVTVSESEVDG